MGDSGSSADAGAGADVGDAFIPDDGTAALKGAVQKGPFVVGSTVTVSTIDSTETSTGQVYTTQTTTDLGDFAVSFTYRGNVDMQAQGFYYDEVTGALSTSPIVLRALYQVSNGGPQAAYINIITHLAHDRAVQLMGDAGVSLTAAEAQAESEVVKALGIGGSAFSPGGAGITLNELGGNNDADAYLFAASAVLMQAAREQAGEAGSIDATLQELLDTIAAAVATGGSLSSALTSELRTAEQDLDVDLTMDLFQRRLQAIGSSATPADLNRAIDSDGDGYRNSLDTCPLVANANQAQVPSDVICKVARYTTWLPPFSSPAASSLDGGGATLYRGDGTGHFSPLSTVIPSSLLDQGFEAIDVNQDGNLDLANGSGWSPGDGLGGFGTFVSFPNPEAGASPLYTDPVLGDFNGDGLIDLVRVPLPTTTATLPVDLVESLAIAKGVFAPATVIPVVLGKPDAGGPPISAYAAWLVAADVNRDHKLDIVLLWWATETVYGDTLGSAVALLGDGAGGFTPQMPVSFGSTGIGGEELVDIDCDGNLDVFTVGPVGPGTVVSVAFGDGTGAFSAPTTTNLDANNRQLVTGDFNADGKTDFIYSRVNSANPSLAVPDVFLSQGRTFTAPQGLHASSARPSPYVEREDMNGDGVADAVLVGPEPDGVWTIQVILMNVLR